MKREIRPATIAAVLGLVVVVVAGVAWKVWFAPPYMPDTKLKSVRPVTSGPSAQQMKSLLDWEKQQHIGPYAGH